MASSIYRSNGCCYSPVVVLQETKYWHSNSGRVEADEVEVVVVVVVAVAVADCMAEPVDPSPVHSYVGGYIETAVYT